MKRRLLSLTLALALILTLLPATAVAAEENRTLTNQEMFALLPASPLSAGKPQTLREAEYLASAIGSRGTAEREREIWEEWGLPEIGLEKEAVFQQIISLTESLVSGKTSDTEKAKAIYQWVKDNIKYDHPVWVDDPIFGRYQEYSLFGDDAFFTFARRTGICDGYTRLCLLMLQIAELPCAYISNSSIHAWNAVYADGRWILFDATHGQWDFGPDDRLYAKETITDIRYRHGSDVCLQCFWNDGTVKCELIHEVELCPDTLVIPDGVTNLWNVFDGNNGCGTLTNVIFPASLREIYQSFSYCKNLTSVVIPDGVTKIEGKSFSYCDKLTSVTIPASVTEIESDAFRGSFRDAQPMDIYYGGSQEQWETIKWYSPNNKRFTVHYNCPNSEQPTPQVPTTQVSTAYASTQFVLVDGSSVEFQCYALKDANGNDTNYIKLRDVASVLNGTAVQFNVGWDGAVNIETGKGYTPNGSEMKTPFSGNRAYENATAETRINGSRADLDAIVLKDDAGGAYTYYKLRDLGTALGFRVDWSAEKGIFIETK